ncbi:MAG: tyrosine-type recombinase/integrase [Thermoflexus sp.]|jgi:integrase/recombinase XerD|nr:tyrosine-type recombinase/integrase [Thermoflexus sp.]MDT7949711.1 tyrosine-type recombinase/integrase [Thermoflexus sp.]
MNARTDAPSEALGIWVLRFLDARIAAEGTAPSTLRSYRHVLFRLVRFLEARGFRRWAEVDAPALQRFLDENVLQRGGSVRTWNQRLAVLRAFFRFLAQEGAIAENPALALSWRLPTRGSRLPLPPDQRQRLMDFARSLPETPLGLRDRLILHLIGKLGLRAGQAVALTLEDIDPEGERLRIQTRAGWRIYTLPAPVRESLIRYLQTGRPRLVRDPENRALLLNRRGDPLTRQGLWRAIRALGRRAGLPDVSPERLRQPPGLPLSTPGKEAG